MTSHWLGVVERNLSFVRQSVDSKKSLKAVKELRLDLESLHSRQMLERYYVLNFRTIPKIFGKGRRQDPLFIV